MIGVVVFVYDDHAAPSLPQGISLKAVVSVLATIPKSALLFMVAACICQPKWPWYHIQRNLNDLQLLDDASRGPLGSIKLLFTRIIQSITSIGALITVLTLALDPFLQQLISYPIKEIYTDSTLASVSRATSFKIYSYDGPFAAAINAGIWTDPPIQTPTCPTGNCTWPGYTSMVLCSRCGKVTEHAVLKDCDIEAYNPAIGDATSAILPCRVELADGGIINAPITVTFSNGTPDGLNYSRDSVASVSILPGPPDTDSSTWYDRTDFGDCLHTTGTHPGLEGPILAIGRASFLHGKDDDVAKSVYDFLSIQLQCAQEWVIDNCFADYTVSVSKGIPQVSSIRTQNAMQFQKTLPVIWPTDNLDQNITYHCRRSLLSRTMT